MQSLPKKEVLRYFVLSLFIMTIFTIQAYDGLNTNPELDAETPIARETGWIKPTKTEASMWDLFGANPLGENERDTAATYVTGGYLRGLNYYFNLPAGAQIDGIEVQILHATWNGNTGDNATISIELLWGGQASSTSTGYQDTVDEMYEGWNANFKNVTFGSPSDLWGRTEWSVDDFSYDNFAVNIEALLVNPSESVDIAWVKIYYTGVAPITADQTGWLKPSLTDNYEWDANIANPLGEDDGECALTDNDTGYVRGLNYDVSLPEGAEIHGIEVRVKHATWNAYDWATISVELRWDGQTMSTTTGYEDTVDTSYNASMGNFKDVILGSSGDLWGRSGWTVDDFSNLNFGVNIALLVVTSGSGLLGLDSYIGDYEAVDIAWINIYYKYKANIDIDGDESVYYEKGDASLMLEWNVSYYEGTNPMQSTAYALILIDDEAYSFNYDADPFPITNGTTTVYANTNLHDSSNAIFNIQNLTVGVHKVELKVNYTEANDEYQVEASYLTSLEIWEDEVIINPWIHMEANQTDFEINYGDSIAVSGYATVYDPSNLGYAPSKAILYVEGAEVGQDVWTNDTSYVFNLTSYFDNVNAVYQVTVELVASNSTHEISKTMEFKVTVFRDSTDDTSDSDTSIEDSVSTNDTEPPEDTGPALDLISPINALTITSGLLVTMVVIRRRKQ